MLNRRTLLAATSGAIALGVSDETARAGLAGVPYEKVDPWHMTPQEEAVFDVRFPTQYNEAIQDFLRGTVDFFRNSGRYAQTESALEAKAGTEAFLKSKGLSATEPTNLSPEECFNILRDHPPFAARQRLDKTRFHIMWDRANRHFHDNAAYYLTEMEKAEKLGPGTMELDPNLVVPDYARYEIHTMPGGYVGNPFAGWLYDYGYITSEDGLRHHGRYVSVEQNHQLPSDGKIKRVLDIGSGLGYSTTSTKQRFPDAEVWGIDVAAPLVRYAHYRATKMNIDVHFAQRLAEATKFPDGHFDMVTGSILFHEVNVEAAKQIVPEIYRVLRPGGVYNHIDRTTVGTSKPQTISAKAADWAIHRYHFERWWLDYGYSNFPAMLTQAGFTTNLSGHGNGASKESVGLYPFVAAVKPV